MTQRRLWTIGSGGLIGSAVVRRADNPFIGAPIPWHTWAEALASLQMSLQQFENELDGSSWALVWAAGAATVSATEEEAESEAAMFEAFAERVAQSNLPADGVILLVSSAGGVHAGSTAPPFDENTPPAPTSPYGRARLAQEHAAQRILGDRWPVILARVSNVYGPGQDLTKLQGLISRLALCSLTREPLNLFVPLSTIRDYIYVDDVADRILMWLTHEADQPPGARVRILASGRGTSVGQLVRTAQDVGRRKIPIAMGSHPSASRQAPDLRFVPSRVRDQDSPPATSIPVGMKLVFDDILRRQADASS